MSWKQEPFVEIPRDVEDKLSLETVTISRTSISINNKTISTLTREIHPSEKVKTDIVVLLLHGASFTSQTWYQQVLSNGRPEYNTLHLVAAMGFRVIAIDLPGYGETEMVDVGHELYTELVEKFTRAADIQRVVIVSPSMSGAFSLPYLLQEPKTAELCGYIPVAPVKTEMYTIDQYKQCQVPTMIVYGTRDKSIGPASLANLSHLPNKEIIALQDAGHACYLNKPEEWHYYLYNFLLAILK